MTDTELPVAQIRAHIGFPHGDKDRLDVLVDGVAVAQIHPTAIRYDMDWSNRVPKLKVEFVAGNVDLETRPPFPKSRAA